MLPSGVEGGHDADAAGRTEGGEGGQDTLAEMLGGEVQREGAADGGDGLHPRRAEPVVRLEFGEGETAGVADSVAVMGGIGFSGGDGGNVVRVVDVGECGEDGGRSPAGAAARGGEGVGWGGRVDS